MKIGFYLGKNIFVDKNTGGGGFTFQECILKELNNLKNISNHEIFIFSDVAYKFNLNNFITLNRYYAKGQENFLKKLILKFYRKIKRIKLIKKFKSPLNKAVLENKINFLWFVTPAYEYIEIPYAYTVWDLQHRLQSFFPEVSVTGWTFEQREERYKFVIPRATYVISGNLAGKKEIVNFYGMPEERVKILPLPTPDLFLQESLIKNNVNIWEKYKIKQKEYIFYPAQFWPHKNHIIILLALKILKEKYNLDFGVVFTGSDKGNLNYIKEKVKELNLSKNIYFLGFIDYKDLINLYKNSFALVFASFFGPDNIPPLEAFSLKCPVIASEVSGSEYQLKDCSLLFDPKNEHDLVNKILELHNNKNIRDKLIENGFNKAVNWTSKEYLKEVFNLIDEFGKYRRCWSSKEIYKHK